MTGARHGPGPRHPVADVHALIATAAFAYKAATERVCQERDCNQVGAARIMRQALRTLTLDYFGYRNPPYSDGAVDDVYFLPMGDDEPWFVKLRVDVSPRRLYVSAFHPQDVPQHHRHR